jgi:hypothetical protein
VRKRSATPPGAVERGDDRAKAHFSARHDAQMDALAHAELARCPRDERVPRGIAREVGEDRKDPLGGRVNLDFRADFHPE